MKKKLENGFAIVIIVMFSIYMGHNLVWVLPEWLKVTSMLITFAGWAYFVGWSAFGGPKKANPPTEKRESDLDLG